MTRVEWEVRYFELMAEKKKLLKLVESVCDCNEVSDGLKNSIKSKVKLITGDMTEKQKRLYKQYKDYESLLNCTIKPEDLKVSVKELKEVCDTIDCKDNVYRLISAALDSNVTLPTDIDRKKLDEWLDVIYENIFDYDNWNKIQESLNDFTHF